MIITFFIGLIIYSFRSLRQQKILNKKIISHSMLNQYFLTLSLASNLLIFVIHKKTDISLVGFLSINRY